MYFNDKTQAFLHLLEERFSRENTEVIFAYPYVKKPTKLRKTVIVVSPGGMEVSASSLGRNCLYGTVFADADVFIPFSYGSPCVSDVISNIIAAVADLPLNSISVSKITADDNTECYTAKCTVGFSSVLHQLTKGEITDD